jgi:antitoxin PrlF
MLTATITSNGRITIPKAVRKALALEAGHRLSFRVREDGVVEMRPATLDLMSLFGAIKPRVRGVSLQDMGKQVRRSLT